MDALGIPLPETSVTISPLIIAQAGGAMFLMRLLKGALGKYFVGVSIPSAAKPFVVLALGVGLSFGVAVLSGGPIDVRQAIAAGVIAGVAALAAHGVHSSKVDAAWKEDPRRN